MGTTVHSYIVFSRRVRVYPGFPPAASPGPPLRIHMLCDDRGGGGYVDIPTRELPRYVVVHSKKPPGSGFLRFTIHR